MPLFNARRSAVLLSLLVIANVAWGLGHELSQTSGDLKLKYEVDAVRHQSGRVSVALTITDQGSMKPLDSVQLVVPSQDDSGHADLVVSLATSSDDGTLRAHAHLSAELAERAELRLTTHQSPRGDARSDRTWYYHTIPVAPHIKPQQPSISRASGR